MKLGNEPGDEEGVRAIADKQRSNRLIKIEVMFRDQTSSLALRKIDQKSLYGFRRRVGLDPDGRECMTALLTDDGRHLLMNGCTAELYLDEEGDVVERKDLRACDREGHPLSELPSTMREPQALSGPIMASEFLEQVTTGVYLIEGELLDRDLEKALEAGEIFRVPFRPRPTCHDNPAFLFKGVDACFLVVAEPCRLEFSRPGQTFGFAEDDEAEIGDEGEYFEAGFPSWGGPS